jgi:hypothetical protein
MAGDDLCEKSLAADRILAIGVESYSEKCGSDV